MKTASKITAEMLSESDRERFWSKVRKTGGCWNWTGATSRGYGNFGLKGKGLSAHRVSYAITHGETSGILVIDHLCRNKKCVNPEHMELVTQRENVLRGNSPSVTRNRAKKHCGVCGSRKESVPYKTKRICRKCKNRNNLEYRRRKKVACD